MEIIDLGLTLEEAEAGLRAASAYEFKLPPDQNTPVVGEQELKVAALYGLLIEKGLITQAEYDEALRLTYNSDLARREQELGQAFR